MEDWVGGRWVGFLGLRCMNECALGVFVLSMFIF